MKCEKERVEKREDIRQKNKEAEEEDRSEIRETIPLLSKSLRCLDIPSLYTIISEW